MTAGSEAPALPESHRRALGPEPPPPPPPPADSPLPPSALRVPSRAETLPSALEMGAAGAASIWRALACRACGQSLVAAASGPGAGDSSAGGGSGGGSGADTGRIDDALPLPTRA